MTDPTQHSAPPAPSAAPAAVADERPRLDFGTLWERFGIVAVLVLLIAILAMIAPNFLTVQNAFNVAQAISVNAVLAAGMTLVILTAGIDLSVGSMVAVAGVVTVLMINSGTNVVLACLAGIAITTLAGALNGAIVSYLMLPAFIVTLGALTALRGVAYSFTEAKPVPIAGESPLEFIGSGAIAGVPTTVLIMAVTYGVFWFVLERTRYGRHIYAIGGNMEAARLAGVRVKPILVSVYAISGLMAGIAGVMFAARVRSGQVTAGEGYELDAITAVILGGTSLFGGKGRIVGTLVGALIIGVLSNGLILLGVPFYAQLIVKGVVVVLAIAIDFLRGRRGR